MTNNGKFSPVNTRNGCRGVAAAVSLRLNRAIIVVRLSSRIFVGSHKGDGIKTLIVKLRLNIQLVEKPILENIDSFC